MRYAPDAHEADGCGLQRRGQQRRVRVVRDEGDTCSMRLSKRGGQQRKRLHVAARPEGDERAARPATHRGSLPRKQWVHLARRAEFCASAALCFCFLLLRRGRE